MNVRVLLIAWTGAIVAVGAAPNGAGGPERAALQESTVRDKVFSADQAKAGKATYDAKCAGCHDGGAMGPELWGDPFLTSWENKSVGTFFERIKTTMPEDSPGSLTESEILNVIAYVLQTNGFAAGDTAMQNGSALAAMKFVRNK
jgi:mono/diheme cytochrome c family protein